MNAGTTAEKKRRVVIVTLYPSIKGFCGDAGYRKTFETEVAKELGLSVDISERIKPIFEVLPKRWVVERTLGWLIHSRQLSKDYEIRICYAEAVVHISHLHTLLKRICEQVLNSTLFKFVFNNAHQ